MAAKLESKINALYQLPLEEFTIARNALAKERSGSERKEVQSLAKPTKPTWAINQLYWQEPATYTALIDASEKLRSAHRSALTGRRVDLRKAEQLHRAALERAIRKTVEIMETHGSRISDPALQSIRTTLSALPTDESPGRLTRAPEPAGFNLLAGIKPKTVKTSVGAAERSRHKEEALERKRVEEQERREEKEREEAERRAEAKAQAERELRQAQQALRDAERRLARLEEK